jgi:hypothetical protein
MNPSDMVSFLGRETGLSKFSTKKKKKTDTEIMQTNIYTRMIFETKIVFEWLKALRTLNRAASVTAVETFAS